MLRAYIFDLDNCLCAADAPGPDILRPILDAIGAAGAATHDAGTLRRIYAECLYQPLDIVARKFSFTPAMRAAAWRAGAALEARGPMRGYADLHLLDTFDAARFLVTSGFTRFQNSKIDALGIRARFTAVYVDAIDVAAPAGKEAIFRQILREQGLQPAEALVIGDNPDSELAAGARAGIRTVQMLRPGVVRSAVADHHVGGLAELAALARQIAAT
ncbi:MAG TPA: HAD family hydrolase [Burkholderiaceae bacterium]|nr:HAD family hydrolase [Burkholderiaceae bacterium]